MKRYSPETIENPYDSPLIFRLITPLVDLLSEYILKVTPKRYKKHLEQRLNYLDIKYSLQEILVLKFILIVILSSTFYLLVFMNIHLHLILILSLYMATFMLPDFLINRAIKKRREEINLELPFLLELLVVIIEGGISFDSAISKITDKKNGPIYTEFNRYISDVKLGSSRKDALEYMAERIKVQDFDYFIRAINQGEKSGVSIITTLKLLAEQMRTKRRQKIKEQALKIPVKILFPLIFFIFPPVFIVILGPGIIRILTSLF